MLTFKMSLLVHSGHGTLLLLMGSCVTKCRPVKLMYSLGQTHKGLLSLGATDAYRSVPPHATIDPLAIHPPR